MDDWEQQCEFWHRVKLFTSLDITHKILFPKICIGLWICALQTTSLIQTQFVAMEMISWELTYNTTTTTNTNTITNTTNSDTSVFKSNDDDDDNNINNNYNDTNNNVALQI
jgi:hypothetical protein